MGELIKLTNIGRTLEKKLNNAGIVSIEQLRDMGSKEAFLKIRDFDEDSCLNSFYALEGAIKNIRWHDLDSDTKRDLKGFYSRL